MMKYEDQKFNRLLKSGTLLMHVNGLMAVFIKISDDTMYLGAVNTFYDLIESRKGRYGSYSLSEIYWEILQEPSSEK